MNPFRRSTLALALMAASVLMVSTACKREDPQIRELTQKAAEADKANQQLNQAGSEQQKKLAQAGVNDIKPNAETLQLTDEQKQALEERIKNEKNSSYQALLQEVLDKVKDVLTQYELPRRIMARKTFQRTTSGKVIRTE